MDLKIHLLHQPCRIYVLSSNVIPSLSEVKTDTPKLSRQWSRDSSVSNYSLYGFGEYLDFFSSNYNLSKLLRDGYLENAKPMQTEEFENVIFRRFLHYRNIVGSINGEMDEVERLLDDIIALTDLTKETN